MVFYATETRLTELQTCGLLIGSYSPLSFYLYWGRNRLSKWSSELREGLVIFQNLLPQPYFRP